MDLGTFYREFQNPPQLASLSLHISSQSMADDLVTLPLLLKSPVQTALKTIWEVRTCACRTRCRRNWPCTRRTSMNLTPLWTCCSSGGGGRMTDSSIDVCFVRISVLMWHLASTVNTETSSLWWRRYRPISVSGGLVSCHFTTSLIAAVSSPRLNTTVPCQISTLKIKAALLFLAS